MDLLGWIWIGTKHAFRCCPSTNGEDDVTSYFSVGRTPLMTNDEVYADLHLHTFCSDGRASPCELVQRVADQGLVGMAVTDHDTVAGVQEAATEAQRHGLTFVPGVELSVTLDDTEIHLLAYGIDPAHSDLRDHLQAMQNARRERAWEMIARLRNQGLDIPDASLGDEITSAEAVGRPHVAAALVRSDVVETEKEAFSEYLGRDGSAYVSKPAFSVADAVDVVHRAGGIVVLAHPGHWTSSSQIRALADMGLDGIETIHPSHQGWLQQYYRRVARGYELVETGGSDYHGRSKGEEQHLGSIGMSQAQWERFEEVLP